MRPIEANTPPFRNDRQKAVLFGGSQYKTSRIQPSSRFYDVKHNLFHRVPAGLQRERVVYT
jgi:hypothetical protein